MFGNSRAVNVNPGLVAAQRMAVDEPCDELFTGPGLTYNQDRSRMARQLFRQLDDSL
jgi:hypothetical protein